MSVKMRKFLAIEHEKARRENRLFDWCWIGGKCACWRPVKNCRRITKGRKKGQIEVELFDPPGKVRTIPANHVKLANYEIN